MGFWLICRVTMLTLSAFLYVLVYMLLGHLGVGADAGLAWRKVCDVAGARAISSQCRFPFSRCNLGSAARYLG